MLPPATHTLRLLAFAVPAALGVSAVQPLLGWASGQVGATWALSLGAPSLVVVGLLLLAARLSDSADDDRRPPWYAAWLLMPGSFLLAGAATMCIFGAFVEFDPIPPTCWALLGAGFVTFAAGLVWVRRAAR